MKATKRTRRDLSVGQLWQGNNPKCQNLGGSKEILALSIVLGRPHESRIVFRNQHGRRTWCTRASFVSWISAYGASVKRFRRPILGPSVVIKQFAWDGWEAFIEDRPLIRAKTNSALAAFDGVIAKLSALTASETT